MGTRAAVFDRIEPPCAGALHEWQRLGTWTVYCRRCYHHHGQACRCPACAPAAARRPKRRTKAVVSYQNSGQQGLLPFPEVPALRERKDVPCP